MRKKIRMLNEAANVRYLTPLLLGLAMCAVMFVMLVFVAAPERYDIKQGAPAPVTVFATKDVEDAVTTQKLRDSAAAQVDLTYRSMDNAVLGQVVTAFNNAAAAVIDLRNRFFAETADDLTDGDVEKACELTNLTLSKSDLFAVLKANANDLEDLFTVTRGLVRDALASTLPEGQESTAISKISRDLLSGEYDPALVSAAVCVTRATLRPNMLIDEETTELNRQKAREAVEVQMCVKGEAVVREGDIVTESQYQILSALGLIQDSSIDILLVCGIALIAVLILAALGLYLYQYQKDLLGNPRKLSLLALIILLVMIISLIARKINTYLMPVSLGIMLIVTLLKPQLGLYVNLLLGLFASLLATASSGILSVSTYATLVMSIMAGPLAAFILTRYLQRTAVLLAGLAVAISNFAVTVSIGLINSTDISAIFTNAAWAAGGGVLGAVLCLGIQPLLEWLFNLVTNAKLLELSNPNQPLLHRLLLEAPGTYHHSIIVANLADAAASAIGANALLARVGAYYHDVGKLKRPMYFKENQMGDNPHERTDPRVSAAILTAHTRDGAQLGRKEHLPAELVDIISRHHGDSPVLYFYDKAKKLYGEDVDVSTFRYEGPRPDARESAVVMLADMVEAATRSMPQHEPQKIEQTVRRLIREKMTDGQLDKSNLTFHDLDTICNAFITVLSGVFHERIEYPDVKLPPRQETSVIEGEAAPKTQEAQNGR